MKELYSDSKFMKQSVKADTVAIAVGFNSNRELYDKFHGKIVDIYMVGDAENASNIMDAIWSANEVAFNC